MERAARVTRVSTRKALAAGVVLAALAAIPLPAQDVPGLTEPVNDFAGVIDPSSKRDIDARIRALERATGDVIVVATVDTFAPFGSIDEMAVKMFENQKRGIGQRAQDNGALILVAVKDRRVGIEVGYGLEEHITDAFAGQTIREIITPRFRRGEMGQGLLEGTNALVNRIAARRGVAIEGAPRPASSRRQRREMPSGLIVALIVMLFFLFSGLSSLGSALGGNRRRRRRGPWSGWHGGVGPFGGGSFGGGFGGGFGGFGGGRGGGFGGGFGGFGGGRSGGGGASGGW